MIYNHFISFFSLQIAIFSQQTITPTKTSLSKHSEAERGTHRRVKGWGEGEPTFSRFLTLQANAVPELQVRQPH